MIADRIGRIGFSSTLKISARAKALKADGIDVIDFSVGEPDFNTPDNVKEAGKRAIDENFTNYTQASGTPELKKIIAKRIYEDHGVSYELDEIIVSPGAKASLYLLATVLFNKGEECLLPAPYWVSYPEQIALAKAIPVVIPTDESNGFKVTPEDLRAAVTYKTKALMLNNPSNPTGGVYTRDELRGLAETVLDEDLIVIADEIYSKIVYDDQKYASFASLGDEAKKRCVLVDGVSKAYSMTGWRIGYAAGPREIIQAMGKVQSHSTGNPCSIAQKAAGEALGGPQFTVRMMRQEFQSRRNYVLHKLKQIPGVTCPKPGGAFYAFPNVSEYFGKQIDGMRIRDSYSMAFYLLEKAHVAIVPGDAFGAPGFIRISYATSMENIEKGMERIQDALARLRIAPREKVFMLDNKATRTKKRVPSEKSISIAERNKLMELVENHQKFDEYYEWNANINGVIIQLRTNSKHLCEFWMENWYPAELESDLEPHGVICAVKGIKGQEPLACYNSESKTAFFLNSNYYGMVRGWALGIVADISERLYDVHSIRASCLDIDGGGTLIMGPTGTGRSTLTYGLLMDERVRIHSDDWVFMRYRDRDAIADISERKFYMRTDIVETYDAFSSLFSRSRCENVAVTKDECNNERCLASDDCVLQKDADHCFTAFDNSRAIVDPNWIGGPGKYARRTKIGNVIILKRDPVSPAITTVDADEAVKYLTTGRYQVLSAGSRGYGSFKNQPFFNPYLLVQDQERTDLQKEYFRRLFTAAQVHMINTGVDAPEKCIDRVKKIMTES
jgi:aspartate/methionine/tyrosine aminotransferase